MSTLKNFYIKLINNFPGKHSIAFIGYIFYFISHSHLWIVYISALSLIVVGLCIKYYISVCDALGIRFLFSWIKSIVYQCDKIMYMCVLMEAICFSCIWVFSQWRYFTIYGDIKEIIILKLIKNKMLFNGQILEFEISQV